MAQPQLTRLLEVMASLRDPDKGCAWDLQQDFQSIAPFTIEEAYEVADAIEQGDMQEVCSEVGDLLFQVVFYAQLGKEQGAFDFEDIARAISDKLIRRHPHVFSELQETDLAVLKQNWQQIKQQEKQAAGKTQDSSVLADIPKGMTPLIRAAKIQKRCASIGFDWPEVTQVVDKIQEETQEVLQELDKAQKDQQAIEEEIGDLLFAVVNLARHLDVEPDKALRKANNKFEKRFRQVEAYFQQQDTDIRAAGLQQMDWVWHQVKQDEKKT